MVIEERANVKITCLDGTESPKIVEGHQRNTGQVDGGLGKLRSNT